MIRDERGYTLVELLVVVAIISISMGFVTFSLNFVFNRNVDAKMAEVITEIRSAKNLQVEKSALEFTIDYADEGDSIVLYKRALKPGDTAPVDISLVKIPKTLEFVKVVGGSDVKVSDLISQNRLDEIRVSFDSTTGRVTTGGYGVYKIKYNDKVATMNIIKQNGKVILNE